MAVLCRDYLIADFEQELTSAGIVGDVVVQAQQLLDETEWFDRISRMNPTIDSSFSPTSIVASAR
jgi:hypothetical protein